MNRKTFLKTISATLAQLGLIGTASATNSNIDKKAPLNVVCGPYLMSATQSRANIVFIANKRSVAEVLITSEDDPTFKKGKSFFDSEKSVGRKHIGTVHNVKIDGLKPNKTYQYKVIIKEVLEYWETYKGAKYGETKMSEPLILEKYPDSDKPLAFKTLSDTADSFSFLVINDIHERVKYQDDLLKFMNKDDEFLVLNGDMAHTFKNEKHILNAFLSSVSKAMQGNKSIFYARGNHECRGKYSEPFIDYFPSPSLNGRTYYAFQRGDTAFLVLDLGEDKADTRIQCGGINDFQTYREKEGRWLKQLIKKPMFKNAKRRIAIAHIPPFSIPKDKYNADTNRLFGEVLNTANLDLMICGHLHKQIYKKRDEIIFENKLNFPLFINCNKKALRVNITDKQISLQTIDPTGNTENFIV